MAALRRSQAKAIDLQRLAERLGRRRVNRGKEPTWESDEFASLNPLTIPKHGGKDLAPGTKRSVLDQLELDVFAWEERFEEDEDHQEDEDGEGNGNGTA